MSMIDIPDIPDVDMSGIPSSLDFSKSLNAGENQAFTEYATKLSSQQNPLDLYKSIEAGSDVPVLKKTQSSLQKQIQSLEDSIALAENNVRNRSRQSLATEGQIQGMTSAARQPMGEQLDRLGTASGRVGQALTQARSDLGTMANLAMMGQDREMEPYKVRMQMVSDQAARMMTGFGQDKQASLDALMAKYQLQGTLTIEEYRQANELARMETRFAQEKEMFDKQISAAGPNTQMVTAGGRQKLINSQTGQVIADLGSSTSGGGGSSPNFFSTPTTTSSSGWRVSTSTPTNSPNTTLRNGTQVYTPPPGSTNYSLNQIDWSKYGL